MTILPDWCTGNSVMNGSECKEILLAEAKDGVVIHPYSNWTLRTNPNDTAQVKLLVTKFGNPVQNATVKISPCNCDDIFSGGPPVGQPPLPLQHPNLTTDDGGIATFTINAKDPGNNRSFIDGQLYPFFYSVEGQNQSTCSELCKNNSLKLLNSLIVIKTYDHYEQKGEEPTWLDDVYPIFKQYAILYPVMTNNFVDLGNYYDVVKYKIAIRESLKLPLAHPNHMPVTRELSTSKRQVIVNWLSQENPLVGNQEHFYSVENLRQDLQAALQLEHSTIPPYLTALASIKFSYNLAIQNVLKEIVVQEMMHMALVANILNAIGGQPSLYSKEFIPRYPSRLPGGVQPDLIVPIEKVSLGLIRNIFMKIEQPVLEKKRISILEHMFDYANKLKIRKEMEGQCQKDEKGESCKGRDVSFLNSAFQSPTDPTVDDNLSPCFLPPSEESSEDPDDVTEQGDQEEGPQVKTKKPGRFPRDDRVIVKQNSTIGGFYIHILNTLGNLTDCGKDNSIFTGNRSKQVDFQYWSVRGSSIEVYDFITAVEAIKLIVEQGEGSSPCNPMTWNTDDGKSLSHYFLFQSVAERREIRVWNKTLNLTIGINNGDRAMVNYTRLCNTTYHFIGPKIPFDPHGVWPMIPNPVMSKYRPGSKAYLQAERFNKVYTKLLKSLHNVFNGQPDTLKDALGIMYSVDLHLKKLVHTPIADDGDPDVGPNAGPTFDFTP